MRLQLVVTLMMSGVDVELDPAARLLSPSSLSAVGQWFSISFSKAPLIAAFVSQRPGPFGVGCDTTLTEKH